MTEESKLFVTVCDKGIMSVFNTLLNDPKVDVTYNTFEAFRKAATSGHTDIVETLLKDQRIDVSKVSQHMICSAAENGHLAVITLLLKDQRIDPGVDKNYPLRWSIYKGHTDIAKLLLKDPRVSMDIAIERARNVNSTGELKLLLKFADEMKATNKNQATIDVLKTVIESINKLIIELSQ